MKAKLTGSRSIGARSGHLVLAILAGSLAGCDLDGLLEVEDLEFPTEESLSDPAALPLLARGAIAEFIRGYSGDGLRSLGYVTASALFTDEFQSSDSFNDRNATDRRNLLSPSLGNPSDLAFEWLQRARRATSTAAAAIQDVRGDTDPELATLLALNGFTYVTLAEGWCGSVPTSNIVGGDFVEGAPLTRAELLDSAVVRFQASQAASPNSLSAVGLGRALLNAGKFAEAAAAVSAVPTSFVFNLEHSDNTFPNPVWSLSNDNGRFTVLGNEGVNGLDFRTANDPRVQVIRQGNRVGVDNNMPLWEQQKYPNRDADLPLATGIEARLIEAEAFLQANNPASFLQRLNLLRGTVPGLPILIDPGTQSARVSLLFRERAFWLYLTGHRLGDLRRLVNQYSRPINTVYPIGNDNRGQPFGSDVVFSVPFEEEQNTRFDRAQCVTTQT